MKLRAVEYAAAQRAAQTPGSDAIARPSSAYDAYLRSLTKHVSSRELARILQQAQESLKANPDLIIGGQSVDPNTLDAIRKSITNQGLWNERRGRDSEFDSPPDDESDSDDDGLSPLGVS